MTIKKNVFDRYELPNGTELTCGACVKYHIGDAVIPGRIEHDGKDYCFLTEDGIKISLISGLSKLEK